MDPADFVISDETLGRLVIKQNNEDSTDDEGSKRESTLNQKSFSCNTCDKQLVEFVDYKNRICSQDVITEANNSCDRPVFNKTGLITHMKTHVDNKQLIKIAGPKNQVRSRGLVRSIFTCSICNRHLLTERGLSAHMEIHTDEKQLVSNFENDNNTKSDGVTTKVFVCPICNGRFLDGTDLDLHMRIHIGEDQLVCDEKQLVSNFENDNNTKSDGVTTKAFICPICNGRFLDGTDLDLHMRIHIGEDQLVCIQCNERFPCDRDLKEHKINLGHFETDIEDEKPVVDQCIEQFPRNGIALENSRIQTTGEKLFACDQCTEKFNLPENLQEHNRIHIDEKRCVIRSIGDQVTLGEISKLSKINNIGSKIQLTKNNINRSELVKKNLGTCSNEKAFYLRCQKRLPGVEDLASRFSRIQPSENTFSCTLCRVRFTRVESFEEHLRYHGLSLASHPIAVGQSKDQLKQNKKSAERVTKNTTDNHFSNTGPLTSTGEKAFACDQCNERFPSQTGLKIHTLSHLFENPFQCDQCGQRFPNENALAQHMNIHFKRELKCDHCCKSYLNVCSLQNHLKKYHTGANKIASGQDNKLSVCKDNSNSENTIASGQNNRISVCKDNSNSENTIVSGQDNKLSACKDNSESQNVEPLSCNQCSLCFTNSDNLRRHMRSHSIGGTFNCTKCSKQYTNENTFKRHVRLHQQKPSSCDICGKQFANINSVKQHQKRICIKKSRGELQAVPCDKCGKQFANILYLKVHLRKHFVEKSHGGEAVPRDQCGKNFANISLLKKHQRIHSVEKLVGSDSTENKESVEGDGKMCQNPFSCKKCDEQFVTVVEYENHVRSHDGVAEEYICIRPFINKRSLVAHSWKIHTVKQLIENVGKEDKARSDDTVEKLFSCDQCNQSFIRDWELVCHVRQNHNLENRYKCDQCNMTFKRKHEFVEHRRTHTGEMPFVCHQCDKVFGLKSSLKQHMKLHSDEMPFQCSECDKRFRYKGSMNYHVINIHGGKLPVFTCNQCGIEFTRRKEYWHHMRKHSNEKLFVCSVCEMKFMHKQSLTIHLRIHTGERPYVCNVCSKGFRDLKCLKKHTTIHNDEKLYLCNICGKSFKRRSGLWSHKRLKHTGKKPHICLLCGKSFSLRNHLTYHMKIHNRNDPEDASYECQEKQARSKLCNVCSRQFHTAHLLKEHMMVHTGEKPYLCDVCSMQFTRHQHLQKHMIRQHAGEKPYECSMCNKKFFDDVFLKRHMQRHTIEKKTSSCNASNRKFRQNAWLERRVQTRSNQANIEKRVNCGRCNKWFTEKKVLRTHMRIHSGEKPYVCKICYARFMYCGYLKNHAKTHIEESTVIKE